MQHEELKQQDVLTTPESAVESILGRVQTVGLSGLGGATEMRRKLEENRQVRQVIDEHIDAEFREGIDFGPADARNPKPTLLKPGAEKACHLFDTHPEWVRDDEVWEMLGKPAGVVCLKCLIVDNRTGKIIGEGRGAEKVGNKARDANKAIKAAEKCAIVDAALYTFMLSERFTQDDAGRKLVNLDTAKHAFLDDVAKWRSGCGGCTNHQFIVKACESELHKKQIGTHAELSRVRVAVLEKMRYDRETGDRLPTGM